MKPYERPFAATAFASDGRQVLMYVEAAGSTLTTHYIFYFDGGGRHLTKVFEDPSPEILATVYRALDIFNTEYADLILRDNEKH